MSVYKTSKGKVHFGCNFNEVELALLKAMARAQGKTNVQFLTELLALLKPFALVFFPEEKHAHGFVRSCSCHKRRFGTSFDLEPATFDLLNEQIEYSERTSGCHVSRADYLGTAICLRASLLKDGERFVTFDEVCQALAKTGQIRGGSICEITRKAISDFFESNQMNYGNHDEFQQGITQLSQILRSGNRRTNS